jgi:ferredoxin hydrogenase large subunit
MMKIDSEKCIQCGMCYNDCDNHGLTEVTTHGVLLYVQNDNCIQCGECLKNCPAGAITEK